jgi:hypothetical protein
MPKPRRKKGRAPVRPFTKKRRLPDPAIKEIEDTVLVINKLIQNVAKMTPAQRTKVSVMVAHAMLGVGI